MSTCKEPHFNRLEYQLIKLALINSRVDVTQRLMAMGLQDTHLRESYNITLMAINTLIDKIDPVVDIFSD